MTLQMSKRDKVLLVILSFILVIFVFYYFVYAPTTNDINRLKERHSELEHELRAAADLKNRLEKAVKKQKDLLVDMDELVARYYPYVAPQYYVDLLRIFSDEHELTITRIDVESPSVQNLSEIFGRETEGKTDPFKEAVADLNALVSRGQTEGDVADSDSLATNDRLEGKDDSDKTIPGAVGINQVMFALTDGNLEQYLNFLESVNKTEYPIYVSNYEVLVYMEEDNELIIGHDKKFEKTRELIMFIEVKPIFIDRAPLAQHLETVVAEFNFEVLPKAESKDNFAYDKKDDQTN